MRKPPFWTTPFAAVRKATRIPFGQEARSKEELGLLPAQLRVVVALIAAEYAQVAPVSIADITPVLKVVPHGMNRLERAGWVEAVGRTSSTAKLYRPTAKAWRELGLEGWSLLKEVA